MNVKVSAKSARLPFHGCEAGYIATTCKGACCRSTVDPSGIVVTIHPNERAALRARGATIDDDTGRLGSVDKRCQFQTDVNLCGLHFTPDKPFGCIASPFTLTTKDTLIVRNRYKLLRCFRDGDLPAYRAFDASLRLLFGDGGADRLVEHLDAGGGDLWVWMSQERYDWLRWGDQAKKSQVVLQ